jgi:gamma-D-glutamyl-L-lysine dipeptidyl-peptidase
MRDTYFTFQPLVPVRRSAAASAEMVTQLLFGDLVEVLASDRQWFHIRNRSDGYEGWIDEKMVLPVDGGWLSAVVGWEYILAPCALLKTSCAGADLPLHLTTGARLPRMAGAEENRMIRLEIAGWKLEAYPSMFRHPRGAGVPGILEVSDHYLGSPYLWGGKSIWGIDCSGFTQMVFAICGVALPRDASQQVTLGVDVGWPDRRSGDLAFFTNEDGQVIHVGLVLPDGNVRHAAGHVHDTRLEPEGLISRYSGKQTHQLFKIKRIVKFPQNVL